MSTPFDSRPMVYVAGPYTHPDPIENTHKTIAIADDLNATGLVTCIVPHLTLLWHMVSPHEEGYWYDYDLASLRRCDALLRLPGESSGADKEVRYARIYDIPVFFDKAGLLEWAPHQLHNIATARRMASTHRNDLAL